MKDGHIDPKLVVIVDISRRIFPTAPSRIAQKKRWRTQADGDIWGNWPLHGASLVCITIGSTPHFS